MSQSLRDKILGRMSELGIQPKRSMGQNFLVSDSVVERIIRAADPAAFEQVIEVGPGLGALTDSLQELSKKLTLIEMDRTMVQWWAERGLDVVETDVLRYPWGRYPWTEGRNLLVSNLPYQVSSRLLIELSFLPQSFDRMVLMFQKEVAQRIMANHKSTDYGFLSVASQIFWNQKTLLEAGTRDFYPSPNVASRVLVFNRRENLAIETLATQDFLDFLKVSFAQRRKKMAPRLKQSGYGDHVVDCLKKIGLNGDVRPQQLDPQQFIDLYTLLKKE